MSQTSGTNGPKPKRDEPERQRSREPGWADGLRQLYDSVVHEPLPGSFDDLLKKLDRAKNERD